jgi:drug/metabolite transporter (DMT)-like permease
VLELLVSSILFSLSFGLIKAEVSALDPLAVALIRLALSAIVFLPFLRRTPKRAAIELAVIGFVQLGVMYCFYIASYKTLAGHQVAILTTSTPLFVFLFDAYLEQRFLRRALYACALAIVAALISVWDERGFSPSLVGLLLVQGANACFALGQLLYRRTRARHAGLREAESFALIYLGAMLAPLVALAFTSGEAHALPSTLRQWGALLYLGLVPSALGFFLWNRGVTRVSAGAAAVMNNAKAPLAVILAAVLFGEKIDPLRTALSLLLMGLALHLGRRSG